MEYKQVILGLALLLVGFLYLDGPANLQSISIGRTLYAQTDSAGTFGPASAWWVADVSMRTGEVNLLQYAFTARDTEADTAILTISSGESRCRYSLMNRNGNYGLLGIIYYDVGQPKRSMPVIVNVKKGISSQNIFMNAADAADRATFSVNDPADGNGKLIVMSEGLHMSETDCASSNNIVAVLKDGGKVVVMEKQKFEGEKIPLLLACKVACPACSVVSAFLKYDNCKIVDSIISTPKPASWSETPTTIGYDANLSEVYYVHSHGTGQLRVFANADFFNIEPVAGETKALAPEIVKVTNADMQEKSTKYVQVTVKNPASYQQSISVRGEAQEGIFGASQNYAFGAGEQKTLSITYAAPAVDGTELYMNKIRACVSGVLSEACDEETFLQKVTDIPTPLIIGDCEPDYNRNPDFAKWDSEECLWTCNDGYVLLYDDTYKKNTCVPDGSVAKSEISWELLAVGGAILLLAVVLVLKGRGKGG